ncbi:hypothetical protein C8J57DRAFT_1528003 [Mycena rebaudengoi]|nr:hypothetical protein C8J57DRAFT_1528003 [Mycena rebaudengoi]
MRASICGFLVLILLLLYMRETPPISPASPSRARRIPGRARDALNAAMAPFYRGSHSLRRPIFGDATNSGQNENGVPAVRRPSSPGLDAERAALRDADLGAGDENQDAMKISAPLLQLPVHRILAGQHFSAPLQDRACRLHQRLQLHPVHRLWHSKNDGDGRLLPLQLQIKLNNNVGIVSVQSDCSAKQRSGDSGNMNLPLVVLSRWCRQLQMPAQQHSKHAEIESAYSVKTASFRHPQRHGVHETETETMQQLFLLYASFHSPAVHTQSLRVDMTSDV